MTGNAADDQELGMEVTLLTPTPKPATPLVKVATNVRSCLASLADLLHARGIVDALLGRCLFHSKCRRPGGQVHDGIAQARGGPRECFLNGIRGEHAA